MAAFIARRLLFSIPVILVATAIIFFGITALGDPLAEFRSQPNVSQVTIQNLIDRKHLDEPIVVQYGFWLQSVFTDAFGTNLFDRPIWPDLRRALWFTLQLIVVAEVLALALGITLGTLSAKRQYSFLDYSATGFSLLGFSLPIFWFALMLQVAVTNLYIATDFRLFYTAGLNDVGVGPGDGLTFLVDRIQHLVLPWLALAYISAATYTRYMRSSMLEVINSDYIRTARAKGLRERTVTRRHALRNALITIVTLAALNFGVSFGGAIVTESVFSIPGMGFYFIDALRPPRDLYAIMAFLLVTGILVIIANLIADILYGYLDPRIRRD